MTETTVKIFTSQDVLAVKFYWKTRHDARHMFGGNIAETLRDYAADAGENLAVISAKFLHGKEVALLVNLVTSDYYSATLPDEGKIYKGRTVSIDELDSPIVEMPFGYVGGTQQYRWVGLVSRKLQEVA